MASGTLPAHLAGIAARQHGVLGHRQLAGDGLTITQIERRLQTGALRRFLGSTYLVAGAPTTALAGYHAATLAVPGSIVGGYAAAHVHGFGGYGSRAPEVIAPVTAAHLVDGVVVRRRSDLLDQHRCQVDGLPVTTIPRTVLDLAASVHWVELAKLVDALVEERRLSIRVLFDEFDLIARRGRNGTTALRRVLEPRLASETMGASELERRARDFLRRFGFPEPVAEFHPPWAGPAVARVDLAYPDLRVVIELDSRRWHDRSDRFENDRLRDQLAMAHGWIVVRITWRQLHDDPRGVARRLRSTLAARSLG